MKIERKTDALIMVDIQNDFCPGGALAVPEGDKIVPIVNSLIPEFDHVYATRDWHPSNHISFKSRGGDWPPHCVADTPGAGYHPDLNTNSAINILKGNDPDREAYSGFQGTDLADRLRSSGIRRLFVCGLATDYCVKSTVIDGLNEGFDVIVVFDAIRGVEVKPGDSRAALEEMKAAGAVVIESQSLD